MNTSRNCATPLCTRCAVVILTFWFAAAYPAQAQWLNHHDDLVPRTPDGKPKLTAPAPKMPGGTPDLSGIWRTTGALSTNVQGQGLANLANGAQIPMLPDAETYYQEQQANGMKDMSSARCL